MFARVHLFINRKTCPCFHFHSLHLCVLQAKLFRVITLLKDAVKQEKEKVFAIESEVRLECAEEMRQCIVEIEESWE